MMTAEQPKRYPTGPPLLNPPAFAVLVSLVLVAVGFLIGFAVGRAG